MGIGGQIVLINGTPYNWKNVNSNGYQMDTWTFPDSVPAGASVPVYIEFGTGIFDTVSDDGAEVYFALEGTQDTFQIQARAPDGNFNLQAYFDGLLTANNPRGSTVNLGWVHDGFVPFILSGSDGNFWSSNPPNNWMQGLLPQIGNRPLRNIVMPGSHDAGMSTVTGGTAFSNPNIVLTQTQNIGDQLAHGSRYFDIRPVIAGGEYATGHYSNVDVVGWQGADGEKIASVISEINAFTASNKELVIINLSHDLNTDVGRDYRSFNQDEWNTLFQQLESITDLYIAPNPTSVDLSTVTLSQFIGDNQAAVVVVVDPGNSSISLGDFANKGFYTYSQYNVYNSYSSTDDLNTMAADQLSKLQSQRSDPNSPPFLLSWTLTQGGGDMVTGDSIVELANEADSALWNLLPSHVSSDIYPNILYIDNFDSSDVTALAVNFNLAVKN